MMSSLAGQLARSSAEEMVAALGLASAPPLVRAGVRATFFWASTPLGRTLAAFDANIAELGISRAADRALGDLEASFVRVGAPAPAVGPLLVVCNHPGAYDALVVLAALRRNDVAIIAAERSFLRALPELARHLLFVADRGSPAATACALRRAFSHLRRGGVLVHFGAGEIEPDPAFVGAGGARLAPSWRPGTGALLRAALRANGSVVSALTSGVHSRRAKSLLVTRLAERAGITTLAPLLQVTLRAFRDVHARVRFSAPLELDVRAGADDDALAELVRLSAFELSRSAS